MMPGSMEVYHAGYVFLALRDRGRGGILAKPKFCGGETTIIVLFIRLLNEILLQFVTRSEKTVLLLKNFRGS